MKKLLVLALVLAMAGMASASMILQVNGVDDPPETEVTLLVDDTALIGVYAPAEGVQGQYLLGITMASTGTGTLDLSQVINDYVSRTGDTTGFTEMLDAEENLNAIGLRNWAVNIVLTDTLDPIEPVLNQLVSKIVFTCTGLGDVTLQLWDFAEGDPFVIDSQVIHQIPEPITMVLLGLGGLMLRRRK
jgi:hypothetical protein